MRGYIYEVNSNPNEINDVSEDDYYNKLDLLGVMCVHGLEAKELEEQQRLFVERFTKMGAYKGKEHPEKGEPFGIVLNSESKQNFFKDKYKNFKRIASNMSLKEFAEADLYKLRNLLNDEYSDMVQYGDTLYTLDEWVREAPCGTELYIGNIISMN